LTNTSCHGTARLTGGAALRSGPLRAISFRPAHVAIGLDLDLVLLNMPGRALEEHVLASGNLDGNPQQGTSRASHDAIKGHLSIAAAFMTARPGQSHSDLLLGSTNERPDLPSE
jgi:hypothetical protein